MAHNSAVLIEWANREAETATGQKLEMVTKLQQVGVEVPHFTHFWHWSIPFPAPDPAGFVVDPACPKPGRYAASGRGAWIRELRPPQNRCQFPVHGNGAGRLRRAAAKPLVRLHSGKVLVSVWTLE